MNWFNRIWKDPVWSKVISTGIIGAIGFIGLILKPYITFLSNIPSCFFIIFLFLIIALIILFFIKYKNSFQYNENTKKNDTEVFNNITKNLLPSNSIIDFVRNQAFGSSFLAERLRLLNDFEYTKRDPNLKFFNPRLENKKQELHNNITNFKNVLLQVTSVNEHGVQSMLSNIHSDPSRSAEVCRELGALADAICANYDELVQIGKEEGF